MGPSGVGKSTFINVLANKNVVEVGHELNSCTATISHVVLDGLPGYPTLQNRRLIIVDTPGFDDTYVDDAEILRRISVWLATSYSGGMTLGGVIYLHDISQTRMLGTTRRNLEMFFKLCGSDALSSVVVGTTKWGEVELNVAEIREKQLCDIFWKPMIVAGSSVHRFQSTKDSAWEIVNSILDKVAINDTPEALQIQKEVVDLSKILPDTEAGRELRITLEQLLENQKRQGNEDQMQKTLKAINELKVSVPKRILMFFGIEV
ncbi:P-loop containing nucleoside triphosphate hydrolase protein, partial [Cyathus striatus]